jgi:hypothetical protein
MATQTFTDQSPILWTTGTDSTGLQTDGKLSPMQDCMQAKFFLVA